MNSNISIKKGFQGEYGKEPKRNPDYHYGNSGKVLDRTEPWIRKCNKNTDGNG